MYLAKLLGLRKLIQTEPSNLTDRQLEKLTTKILHTGIEAIEQLNLTPEELRESHNKQKAFTVAWIAMYTTVCSLSHRPTWDQLPGPKDAYEKMLKHQN